VLSEEKPDRFSPACRIDDKRPELFLERREAFLGTQEMKGGARLTRACLGVISLLALICFAATFVQARGAKRTHCRTTSENNYIAADDSGRLCERQRPNAASIMEDEGKSIDTRALDHAGRTLTRRRGAATTERRSTSTAIGRAPRADRDAAWRMSGALPAARGSRSGRSTTASGDA